MNESTQKPEQFEDSESVLADDQSPRDKTLAGRPGAVHRSGSEPGLRRR